MRQKPRLQKVQAGITKCAFPYAVVTGFVVLQAVMANLVTQGVEKMVLPVMACSKQRTGLIHEFLVTLQIFCRHLQISGAVTYHVNYVTRSFSTRSEFYLPVLTAGNEG